MYVSTNQIAEVAEQLGVFVLWLVELFTATVCFLMSGGSDVMAGNDRIPSRANLELWIAAQKVRMSLDFDGFYEDTIPPTSLCGSESW